MKQSSTVFLKTVLILIAAGVAAALLWFPQTEGRAANLDLVSIYADPFIIYIYIASIPFFVALFQAFTLFGLIGKNKTFSQKGVDALRNIKRCAITIICLLVAAMGWIRFTVSGNDDPAGAIAIGIILTFASIVVATAAAVFQRLLQNAVDLKHENDLTV